MTQLKISILILAAGQSRRMRGADKLLLALDGQPLLRRCAQTACDAQIGPVFVALPPAPHPRDGALAGLDVTPVRVTDAAEGINASLRAGLRALPQSAQAVMILLADLPDLTAPDIRTVARAALPPAKIWRAATQDGKPGHPVVFDRSLFAELAALTGDRGARDVAAKYKAQTQLIPLPASHARRDIDTPQEWQAYLSEHKKAPHPKGEGPENT